MRDVFVVGLVIVGCLVALRRPWVGVMLWTWLSIMNPHRFTYGFAYSAPLAAMAAGSLLVGLLLTKDRSSPFKGPPMVWAALFMTWFTASWLLGLDPARDYAQWNKVIKIYVMTFVGMMLLDSKKHVLALIWVTAGSLAILGLKGGVFTLATGGNYRVWGPPGSFIADNNEMALALVMTIPILRFLQLQLVRAWARHALTLTMLLCAAAALGSHSRGGLLAMIAMALVLWWRGRTRVVGGVVMVLVAVALVAFMPQSWTERMNSISDYGEDRSAMGRISAWWNAFGIAKTYVFGVGFNAARPELFMQFSPYPDYVHAAHSIYFQVMGNHGFIGLLLFVGMLFSTFRAAGKLRQDSRAAPQAAWCGDLGSMVQVSLIGYAVGGAFLSLAYFDLPLNLMMAVVLARVWVRTQGWQREPVHQPGWFTIPGLVTKPSPLKSR